MAEIYSGGGFWRFNASILLALNRRKKEMKTVEKKRTVSFMVPEAVDDQIEYLASIETRSKSNLIRRAVELYLAQYSDSTPTT